MVTNASPPWSAMPFQGLQEIRAAFAHQIGLWAEMHGAILSDCQNLAGDWFQHRREAVTAMADAARSMCACKDVDEVSELHHKWLLWQLEWFSADARILADGTAAVSQRCLDLMIKHGSTFADFPGGAAKPQAGVDEPPNTRKDSRPRAAVA